MPFMFDKDSKAPQAPPTNQALLQRAPGEPPITLDDATSHQSNQGSSVSRYVALQIDPVCAR
jgi:hypothetical protein